LPSPFHFFRVREGFLPNSPASPPVITSVARATNGFLIQWIGSAGSPYQAQWTPALLPPAWNSFPTVITSATGVFSFVDDGSQTGGLGPMRFYRLIQLP